MLHVSEVVFDGSFRFPEVDRFLEVFPLIVHFFASAERNLHLDETFFKIEPSGDDGASTTLDGLFPLMDLPLIEEQLAWPVGVVVGTGAKAIFGNMGVVEDRNSPIDANEAIVYLNRSLADGFDFGSRENDAGFEGFIDKEIPLGGGVTDFAVAIFRLQFTAHRKDWPNLEKKRRLKSRHERRCLRDLAQADSSSEEGSKSS